MDKATLQGFIWGLLSAAALGFVFQRLLFHMGKAHAAGQKQKAVVETKQTPLQVLWEAIKGLILFAALMAGLYLLNTRVVPTLPADIARVLSTLIWVVLLYAGVKFLVPSLTKGVPFILRVALIALVLYIAYRLATP